MWGGGGWIFEMDLREGMRDVVVLFWLGDEVGRGDVGCKEGYDIV